MPKESEREILALSSEWRRLSALQGVGEYPNTCECCERKVYYRLYRWRCHECFAASPWRIRLEGYWRRWWFACDPRWWSLKGIGTRISIWWHMRLTVLRSLQKGGKRA